MPAPAPPVFDGHNDVALRLWGARDLAGRGFVEGDAGHVDLPRARAGGLAGGIFALFVPDDTEPHRAGPEVGDGTPLDLPLAGPVDADAARRVTLDQAAILLRLARGNPDDIRLCRTADEVEAARAASALAIVMHLEGCEAIGPDLAELHVLHAAGLRSLGPVWSRPNAHGHGVPFRHPGDPDEGPGLSDLGKRLVAECNALRVMVDLSHLNAAGGRDVAAISDAPLVATHSCAHALAPAARNLTDDQLRMIAGTGGLVGLNFAVAFLRADGGRNPDTPIETMIRHLDHLLGILGEGGVALGSDFDGALVPRAIGDAAGLPKLVEAMRRAGYGETLIERICWSNWLDVLRRTAG